MAVLRIKKNRPDKGGDREGYCYYCKALTSYELEETSGVQITDKYVCASCLTELLKGVKTEAPEIFLSNIENLLRSGDGISNSIYETVRIYDPKFNEALETIKAQSENIVELEASIVNYKKQVTSLKESIEIRNNQPDENETPKEEPPISNTKESEVKKSVKK